MSRKLLVTFNNVVEIEMRRGIYYCEIDDMFDELLDVVFNGEKFKVISCKSSKEETTYEVEYYGKIKDFDDLKVDADIYFRLDDYIIQQKDLDQVYHVDCHTGICVVSETW